MRRLGPLPLTGAEKQRRHRERVKARLAEAERLKALLGVDQGNIIPGLVVFYDHILAELGAAVEERELLKGEAPNIQNEIRAALEARARHDLQRVRATKRRRESRKLARLDRKQANAG
jgi:hypothetical protein